MVNIINVIKIICEKIISLNSNYVSKTTFQNVCNAKTLIKCRSDVSTDTGDSFYLIGNIMRGKVDNSSVNLKAGNIASKEVSHPWITENKDNPFFKKIIGNCFISGGYGNVCTLNISDSDVTSVAEYATYSNITHYSIEATATHAAISGRLNSFYYTPVEFNIDYFNNEE